MLKFLGSLILYPISLIVLLLYVAIGAAIVVLVLAITLPIGFVGAIIGVIFEILDFLYDCGNELVKTMVKQIKEWWNNED